MHIDIPSHLMTQHLTRMIWKALPPEQGLKFLVGERHGVIRMFHKAESSPLMSLSCRNKTPLYGVSWSALLPSRIGAVAGDSWLMWNSEQSSLPDQESEARACEGGFFRCVSWAELHPAMYLHVRLSACILCFCLGVVSLCLSSECLK